MAKVKIQEKSVVFYCQGCSRWHYVPFNLVKEQDNPIEWYFNGNLYKPTITPSIKNTWHGGTGENKVCHVNITDGQIYFHGDCTHRLAGRTLEVQEIE